MISIDEKKCTGCGICYEICPSYVFSKNEEATTVKFPELCSICGHCLAICPAEAIFHESFSNQDFPKTEEVTVATADLKSLILSRRSIRKYKEKPVPDEIIDQLLECCYHAGSGGNIQSEEFAVINDREFLRKLEPEVIDAIWGGGIKFFNGKGFLYKLLSKKFGKKLTKQFTKYNKIIQLRREKNDIEGMIFRGAPAVIIIHGLKENYLAQTNSAIAIRNVELMAQTMGLGSCHAGFLVSAGDMSRKKINKILGIDNSRQIFGALMIGYPKYKYKKRIPREKREVARIG